MPRGWRITARSNLGVESCRDRLQRVDVVSGSCDNRGHRSSGVADHCVPGEPKMKMKHFKVELISYKKNLECLI